jgi:hypothetical protein
MRRKLPILVLALIILLQAFVPAVYAASKIEAISSNVYLCPFDTKSEGAGSNIKFGSDTKSIQKLSNQMTQRGWNESTVRNTVSSPHTTRISTNKATGNSATVYYNKSGGYVIIDDVTEAVVQVSDNINPSTWIPDPSIINPYKP